MEHKLKSWGFLLIALWLSSLPAVAQYPSWWIDRGMVSTNSGVTTNDYATLNTGTLKWWTSNAYVELEANLPGGGGSAFQSFISNFTSSNNYYGANIGMLKNCGENIYDRLIEEGYTNSYPWTLSTTDDVDYAQCNVGQIKKVFSFDLTKDTDGDGLVDWREDNTGTFVDQYNAGSDPNDSDSDDDGTDDGDEIDNRTDPNNSDTNLPTVTLTDPTELQKVIWIP